MNVNVASQHKVLSPAGVFQCERPQQVLPVSAWVMSGYSRIFLQSILYQLVTLSECERE